MTIDDIIAKLERAGWGKDKLVGCTEDEVRRMDLAAGGALPDVYQEFLLKLGRNAGPLCRDLGMLYTEGTSRTEHQRDLHNRISDILVESGSNDRLPDRTFFFADAQGYFFYFFDLDDPADDPVVYGIGEEGDGPQVIASTFTEFILMDEDI